MTYPQIPLGYRLEVAPTADLTTAPSTYTWVPVTADLAVGQGLGHKRGSADEQGESTSESAFALRNNSERYSTDNALSDLWPGWKVDCPVRMWMALDGATWVELFTQYVAEIRDEWPDRSGQLAYTQVRADGIFRRLAAGDALRSPLNRSMSGVSAGDYVPVAYWPMEEGRDATRFASGLAAGTSVVPTGSVTYAADSTLVGSDPLPTFAIGASVTFPVPTYTDTGQWVVQLMMRVPSAPAAETTYVEIRSGGSAAVFKVTIDAANVFALRLYDAAGTLLGESLQTYTFYGQWLMLTLALAPIFTAEIRGRIAFTAGTAVDIIYAAGSALTSGAITSVTLMAGSSTPVGFGHPAIWTTPAFNVFTDATNNAAATNGYANELAHKRVARICREVRIPSSITATRSTALGPQQPGTIMDVLRAAEKADHGQLDDSRGAVGYRAYYEMCNQAAALVIDASLHQLGFPLTPVTDDQRLVNKSTVTRTGGSWATVSRRAAGAAERARDATLNLATDSQTPHHASLIVSHGSVSGKRVPQLTIDLLTSPQLAAGFLALRLGDRVTVINAPRALAKSGTLDVIFTGWATATKSRRQWKVTANCAPYAPYDVAVYGPAAGQKRYGSGSVHSSLTAGITSTATSVQVSTAAGGRLWIATPTHPTKFPIPVEIGGPGGLVYSCRAIGQIICPNAYLDTSAAGWTASNSTIVRSTAQAHEGVASLLITPDGVSAAGGVNASARAAATAGGAYFAGAWVYSPAGWADLQCAVDWYTATSGGAFISTGFTGSVSVAAGVWTFVGATLTAPGTTAAAVMRVRHGGTPPAGAIWYADEITLIPTSTYTASPQTLNLVRLAADKAHLAGSPVRPFQPGRYGLS